MAWQPAPVVELVHTFEFPDAACPREGRCPLCQTPVRSSRSIHGARDAMRHHFKARHRTATKAETTRYVDAVFPLPRHPLRPVDESECPTCGSVCASDAQLREHLVAAHPHLRDLHHLLVAARDATRRAHALQQAARDAYAALSEAERAMIEEPVFDE